MRGIERQAEHYTFADTDLADAGAAQTVAIPDEADVEAMLRGPSITEGMNRTR